MKCWNCKGSHETVADVRACHEHAGATPEGGAPPAAQDSRWKTGDALPFLAGRYAILDGGVVKFYKVDAPEEGRWAGYVFVKVQASDDLFNVRSKEERERIINTIIEQGWKECLLRYGRELGTCGHCGRTLTNEESRAYGIGPVCRRDGRFAQFA